MKRSIINTISSGSTFKLKSRTIQSSFGGAPLLRARNNHPSFNDFSSSRNKSTHHHQHNTSNTPPTVTPPPSTTNSTSTTTTITTKTSTTSTSPPSENSSTVQQILVHLTSLLWPKDSSLKTRVVAAMGLLIGAKLFNVSVPFFFKRVVDSFTPTSSTAAETIIQQDPAIWMTMGPISMIIGYGIAKTLYSLFTELRGAIFAKVTQASIRLISLGVFSKLLNMDLNFHVQRKTGTLTSTMDRGKRGINFLMTSLLFNIVPTLLELSIVTAIFYINYGPNFALTALGSVSLYAAWTIIVTQWRTKIRKQMNKAENEASGKVVDSLINFETVKYFQNEKYESERYDDHLKKYEQTSLKIASSLSALNFGQTFIFSCALTYIMYITANKIMLGELSVGDLVMVNTLLFQLSIPLNFLGTMYRETSQAITDIENLFTLLDSKSEMQDDSTQELIIGGPMDTEIEFRNVSFYYDPNRKILDNVSFTVKPGTTLGICGPSGSGKSTILKLIYRFYDPTEGQILINGQDIKTVSLQSLRRHIGVIPQDCVLFNDTLKHNIEYGKLGCSEEEIRMAANKAKLGEIIERLPKGLETQVGERGLKLSGGEKQRTAIARAILKSPKILCCDESTSSLDSNTEKEIMNSIEELFGKTTSIMIAHRLSTIQRADQIIVLNNSGSIAESGFHEQLITKHGGVYAEMWKRQVHH